MTTPRPLYVWYVAPLRRCNFKCRYCVSHQPLISDNLEWHREEDAANHLATMAWIKRLPFRVRLRLGTAGEPFVSRTFLDTVADISRAPSIEFVEVLTNGSFTPVSLGRLADAGDPSRLTLWMTYHHEEMDLEKFVEAAQLARSRGFKVIAHALIFPDSGSQVLELKGRCDEAGLTFHAGLGLNYNEAYPGAGHVPVLTAGADPELLALNQALPDAVYQAAAKPLGAPCAAGFDYIYINRRGEVHQCNTYGKVLPQLMLGSSLDPEFVLELRAQRYEPCLSRSRCVCVEDFQHLRVAQAAAPAKVGFLG